MQLENLPSENSDSGIFGETTLSKEQLQSIQPYDNESDPGALTTPLLNWSIREGVMSIEVYIHHQAQARPSKEGWQKNGIVCTFQEVGNFDTLTYTIPVIQIKELRIISKEPHHFDTVPNEYSIEIDLYNEDKLMINSSFYGWEPEFWCYNHRIRCILKDM